MDVRVSDLCADPPDEGGDVVDLAGSGGGGTSEGLGDRAHTYQ
jgi:hypothetical protein